jgi:hypothetical protein
MIRPRHPDKDIEAAVAELEALGWAFKAAGRSAHCWGRLRCPHHDRSGCQVSVWSTPRSPGNHAAALRRAASRCEH